MTKRQYEFLVEFNDKLIQPIIDKLDADQQRSHPLLKEPLDLELAKVIRSLKVEATSHHSFRLEFTCKGDSVVATMKKNFQHNPRLEHSLWELHNLIELVQLKHTYFARQSELNKLRKGIYSVLQILNPEVYGNFNYVLWN